MAINWGLANPNGAMNALAQGFQLGSVIRERQDERERKNALAAYDPSNPETLKPIMQQDPRMGLQLQQQQAEAARAQREQMQQQGAILSELLGNPNEPIDPNEARRRLGLARDHYGFAVDNIPDPADPAFAQWRSDNAMLANLMRDDPDLLTNTAKEVMLSLPPEARDPAHPMFITAMRQAMMKVAPVQSGGSVVGYGAGVEPHYVIGGASGAGPQGGAPQPGVIEDGYRFKGGNPADPNSWEQVGGGSGNAAGGFPAGR